MGQRLQIEWQETADQLQLFYRWELNPCERVFEWLRGQIEGEVYASLQHKRRVIDQLLRRLNADKLRVQQLIRWHWIQAAFAVTSTH